MNTSKIYVWRDESINLDSPLFGAVQRNFQGKIRKRIIKPSLAEHDMLCLSKELDRDQLASEEFVIKYMNFYQKPGSSNLIGWKLEVGVAF